MRQKKYILIYALIVVICIIFVVGGFAIYSYHQNLISYEEKLLNISFKKYVNYSKGKIRSP